MDTQTRDAQANKLLASLPLGDFQVLRAHFVTKHLAQGELLFDADDEVDQVYFPLSGMISLLSVLQNGNGVETATVGREGVVGAMAGLGLHRSHVKAVAQLESVVARIQAAQFRKVAASRPAIVDLCIRYNEVLLSQARITAACNLTHAIEARLCRWLLQTYDRAESNILPLTQEFLSEMLGVRRTSITDVAMKMQNAGAISYSRGTIKIVALERLKEVSCECYETMREQAAP
ncbi:Crp/Fnr family transcriptional regulator [Bradyrhizobium sp. dw_411]|uniref:Crp/Fnr family transcriptional regulator n=1 Tax=Bradyrhizobium sp. dw_411 TaxID=2720082 RepID=UPI001BCFF7DC|nr:Crp/Fnr family transcriptional regulator [Bradyrhizobium sp. dw_411]